MADTGLVSSASFCQLNHGVSFPLMKKSDVNGEHTNDVFKFLKERKSGLLGLTRIKWNFEKCAPSPPQPAPTLCG